MSEDPRRAAWLLERRRFLTASDVAAVMEEDPRRGPYAVWLEKVHGYEQTELRIMRRGLLMEPVIRAEYGEETKRPVFEPDPYTLVVHPSIPWLASTLDGKTEGCELNPAPAMSRRVPLELKNVAGVKAAQWRDDPPTEYQIQAQIQLACTAEDWASLAAMIAGAAIAWKDVLRHERWLSVAFPRLEAFWLKVKRKQPPEADGLPGTTAALKAIWSRADGSTVPLDLETLKMADDLDRAHLSVAQAEDAAQTLENRLRARMAGATFGALPDGSFLTLKVTEVRGHTRVVEPFSYRRLGRYRPPAFMRRTR